MGGGKTYFLFASYFASSENTEADRLSRLVNLDIEWELHDSFFMVIEKVFGRPDIDLFANASNAKCATFYSWRPEPGAAGVDAFTMDCLEEDTPSSGTSPVDCRQSIGEAFVRRGVPKEALDIMLASLAPSTIKQYEGAIKKWELFSSKNQIDFFAPDGSSLISFLTESYREGASYGTLNTYRAAVSLISHSKVGEDPMVSRFFKGVFRLWPSKPKYSHTWDVAIVLDFLRTLFPLEELSLQDLSYKALMLIALSTAQRAQTLANIKISNICKTAKGIEIKIPELIKTSGPGRFQPLLVLPRFEQDQELCVASVILRYIEVTRPLRGEIDNLFIALKKPHKPIGSQSISRWIKTVLAKSGIDTAVFSAHSTRHAASSAGLKSGVNIDTIRRTAGWSENSQTFARFYNRPIGQDRYDFASKIIRQG
ncbi:hypothetical protein TSAR_005436 [Trichomalopsis sarcophagae]|uniref:Tyr recombinase domain-containing protein n=1 Tax=Trichomalopsis sarcophagae TaxID=543379 RepID=A0A232F8K9_9HYME|nr:hypothetical protein TSAR_005436 [Trichomalopsis sarcophagae]